MFGFIYLMYLLLIPFVIYLLFVMMRFTTCPGFTTLLCQFVVLSYY